MRKGHAETMNPLNTAHIFNHELMAVQTFLYGTQLELKKENFTEIQIT
jgi:hypothetical protein